jgi:hypothetical protein
MAHYTDSINSSSEVRHATVYQGSGGPLAPSFQNRNTSTVPWLCCWRCGALLSLFQGSIVGVQVYCTRDPCRCAAPAPAACHCRPGPLQQVQSISSMVGQSLHPPITHGQNAAANYRSSVSQSYATPFATWPYPASAAVSRPGQTRFHMEQDIRHVGTHLDGIVPPTTPSPDILTGNAPGPSGNEFPCSTVSRLSSP